MDDRIYIDIISRLDNKGIKAAENSMTRLNRTYNTVMKSNNMLNKSFKGFEDVSTVLNKAKQSGFLNPNVFQGWAMSLMFAGMALQRISSSIYKFGTKAFQEISHSIEGTVTNTDMLEGSMKYLGYTIGNALEPMLALIIPIVDKFSEWAESHPGLVQAGVAILAILGTLLSFGGALTLAWTNGLQPFIAGLTNTNWTKIGENIQKGIGGIAVGFGIAWTADAIASMADDSFLETAAKGLGGALTTFGGMKMVMGKGGAGLVAIGVSLKLLGEHEFFQTFIKLFGALGAFVITAMEYAVQGIKEKVLGGIASIISDLIKSNPMLKESLGGMLGKLQPKKEYDFGKEFSKNLLAIQSQAVDWDAALQGAMNPVKGASSTSSNIEGKPIYYINIAEVKTENLDVEEIYRSIEKVGGVAMMPRPSGN